LLALRSFPTRRSSDLVPVAGGGADNACAAVGNGVVRPGLALVSIGTSGVVLAYASTPQVDMSGPVPRVHTFNHAVPQAWYLMGVDRKSTRLNSSHLVI